MVLDIIYSWRFYSNLKSGMLLDYYTKRIVYYVLLRPLFIYYNRYFGETFLVEYLSIFGSKTYTLFLNFYFNLTNMKFSDWFKYSLLLIFYFIFMCVIIILL